MRHTVIGHSYSNFCVGRNKIVVLDEGAQLYILYFKRKNDVVPLNYAWYSLQVGIITSKNGGSSIK